MELPYKLETEKESVLSVQICNVADGMAITTSAKLSAASKRPN